jgi:hypothetical protein
MIKCNLMKQISNPCVKKLKLTPKYNEWNYLQG